VARARDRTRTTLVLALVVTLFVAGCAGAAGPGTPTSTPDDSRSATAPPTTGGHYRAYEVTVRETTPTEVARAVTLSRAELRGELVWRGGPFVAALYGTGTAERVVVAGESTDDPGPFANGTLLLTGDGDVDRLAKRVVDRRAGTGYGLRLSGPLSPDRHEDYARAEREAVAYDDLAPADRRLFAYAAPPRDDPPDGVATSGYTYVFANASARESSTLVEGDRGYVRYGGELYRVRTDGERADAVRYRVAYARRPAEDSLDALYEAREGELVADLDAAGPAVRRLVRGVVANGTAEWSGDGPAPGRFRATWDWVDEHPPERRRAFVRVDGRLYEVRVLKTVE